MYRPESKHDHALLIPFLALIHLAGNIAIIMGLYLLFEYLEGVGLSWLADVIGSVCGSVALSLGFFPQVTEYILQGHRIT
jgi:hypothetical protein